MKNTRTAKLTILAVAAMMLAGCAAQASASPRHPADLSKGTAASELRLGYFANVTHAPALVGLQEGILQKDLGATKLQTQIFNAGPATIEALSAGAIDAAYLGPNPAINSFIQSRGASVRIVAGATTGGAELVVSKAVTDPKQLAGKTLATPQLGNTQDVALRTWLKGEGYRTSITGGGDVDITPTDNAQTLQLFQQGKIDGAWVPEPWASRLVAAGGHVLVDEASLWKDGKFPTTVLAVNAEFLQQHPQTVKALVQGDVDAVAWLNSHKQDAATVVNAQLQAATGKQLPAPVLTRALQHVAFSSDPQAQTFQELVDHGLAAGTQKKGSIDGLFDLRLLNEVAPARASADGLGED